MSNYLMHHGVKGMKWGIRRYQNKDGSLTAEGRHRYKVDSVGSTILRTFANGEVGQRLAVSRNKGYRRDLKDIKKEYKEQKKALNRRDSNYKSDKAALKQQYKQNKTDARIATADAIYGKQSHELNKKIQSQSHGKTLAKTLILGSYGSLHCDEAKVDRKSSTGKALASGIIANSANAATLGYMGMADSVIRRQR